MRRRIRPIAVIAISAAVGIASIGSRAIEPRGWNRAANGVEMVQIQERLARVEARLAALEVSNLTPVQRANRSREISVLHEYWCSGRFPHNHDFPNQRMPYFQDRHGTPGELAYLMVQSGRQDLVDWIAAVNNNGTAFEIANEPKVGPAFRSWLSEVGLTVDEAALMQSFYGDSQPS